MRIRKELFDVDLIPRFYGKAHPGFCNGYPCQIFYPIPLNIILGLVWSVWMWFRHFKTPLADRIFLKYRVEEAENQLRLMVSVSEMLVNILEQGDGKIPDSAKIIYNGIVKEWGKKLRMVKFR